MVNQMKILLVDDEADFRKVMTARIKGWGHDLIEAENGKEAIEAAKNKKPDMLVLDYMLPDMDGIAILKSIRKINKKIPVIMFTAYPDMKVMDEAGKLGISAFIPKATPNVDVILALKSAIDMTDKRLK